MLLSLLLSLIFSQKLKNFLASDILGKITHKIAKTMIKAAQVRKPSIKKNSELKLTSSVTIILNGKETLKKLLIKLSLWLLS